MIAPGLIEQVEERLARIYRFPLVTSAVPFFMKKEQFVATSPEVSPPRAAVFLTQTAETLDIGIFIEDGLLRILHEHDPNRELNSENLDAYCVLIEELSHFHLLLQRSQSERGVSQLELEWQGEVDKLLLAGLLMSEQKQTSCFKELHHSLFEASILSEDPVYQEASHYAAKCWHRLLPRCHNLQQLSLHLLPVLQSAYHGSWPHKLRLIQSL